MHRLILWLPRILAIAYILFLAVFALDVFEPGKTAGFYLVALLMHLVPNFILAGILFIAWTRRKAGGIIFILAAGLLSIYFANPGWVNLALFGPLFLIGCLFLWDGFLDKRR